MKKLLVKASSKVFAILIAIMLFILPCLSFAQAIDAEGGEEISQTETYNLLKNKLDEYKMDVPANFIPKVKFAEKKYSFFGERNDDSGKKWIFGEEMDGSYSRYGNIIFTKHSSNIKGRRLETYWATEWLYQIFPNGIDAEINFKHDNDSTAILSGWILGGVYLIGKFSVIDGQVYSVKYHASGNYYPKKNTDEYKMIEQEISNIKDISKMIAAFAEK
ncbi:MAG: hypothetical protein LBL61_04270 [Elusimicrobiota bacterium]|nr:hypothetical protein [Elusimicrobiota bacterium]